MEGIDYMLLPAENVMVDLEAILFRAVIQDSATEDGGSLRKQYESQLRDMVGQLFDNCLTAKGKE